MFKFWFDEQHLLTLDILDEGYSKEYSLCLSWYQFSSKDKGVLVYNKRAWRIVHLKEISEWMQACFLQERSIEGIEFNVSMLENVLALFQWFNEETWEKYHYLPFYSKSVEFLENDLKNSFWISVKVTKEAQWTFVRWIEKPYMFPDDFSDIMSLIFWLVVVYWKFDEKNWEVSAIKAHIPLVWWTRIDEELDWCFRVLAEKYWVFIAAQRVQNWAKRVYQFSSNDREVLKLFVGWMNTYFSEQNLKLENYLKKQEEIKEQLVEYIKNEESLNIEWKDEVLDLLNKHNVKFIKCL